MADMDLPFFVGDVARFVECDVDTEHHRKSKDGTKAVVHMHDLTIDEFDKVRKKSSILAKTHEQALELMAGTDWT